MLDEVGFRICHFSVQRDHLHLICEARNQPALARGIRRFKQRVARGINRQLGGRKGSVFLDRYHMEILKNPRQTRNTLLYVLQNALRHGVYIPAYMNGADPYSSALHFDGWKDDSWRRGLSPPPDGPCVSTPATWLLATGWRRHGLIGIGEVPSAGKRRPGGAGAR